ncbi:hypothetical protein LTR62_000971 [Meristemomyces frigidus]|uniref:Elongin-C n=1 Tax=Meristemomyces frigidus TaxID=1508187 RepID=A0AAN7T8X1_9PEZI|nr:hypothetical protein LTR62_000971 [Meristemomyces frigidus]
MDDVSEYVTLISSDDFHFVVQRSAACVSKAIARMLNPMNGFMEAKTNTIRFDSINGVVLEKVCEYFYYNKKNHGAMNVPDPDLPTELLLELVVAADYLDT